MAKKKRKIKQSAPAYQRRDQKERITELVRANRRNLLVGGAIVVAVALITLNSLNRKPTIPVTSQPGSTPTPTTTATATPSATPTQSEQSTSSGTTKQTAPVKKLPLTAGEPFTYTVVQNDSLYKIGITFCNDKAAWIAIADQNNILSPYVLHQGNTLTISCY